MSESADRLAAARSRLTSLRYQAQRLVEVTLARRQVALPNSPLTNYAMAELGGALTQTLIGRKRPGQSIVRSMARNNQEAMRQRQLSEARNQAQAMLGQVETEIRGLEGAIKSGDRRRLLQAVATARGSVRPQTMANRCLAVIDRLSYLEPSEVADPEAASLENSDLVGSVAAILRSFERRLRQHISQELARQSPAWWNDLVTKPVRDQAEHRRSQRERQWPWSTSEDTDLIHFVDFKDYAKIITDARNWETTFARVFRDKEFISLKLRELEPIRIEISHCRILSRKDSLKLSLYSSELTELMRHQ